MAFPMGIYLFDKMVLKNFGYTIKKDRQIDYDSNSRQMFDDLSKKAVSIRTCMACGSCTSTCSAGQFVDFSFRRLILNVQRGETPQVAAEVAKCMLCGKCLLVCPRGVNTRQIILEIKRYVSMPKQSESAMNL